MRLAIIILLFALSSCHSNRYISLPSRPEGAMTGNEFYHKVDTITREERESIAMKEIFEGNMPHFMRSFVPVHTSFTDSSGRIFKAVYFVAPDYLCIGSDKDFGRIPLTPMTAQGVADSLHCFLPTRKMVDDIYKAAHVKLEPVPLYIYRDSALIFWHHNLIIEGQRKNRKGLIAGIKKDVVISGKIARDPKPNRVAIYGWHKLDGKPIQPLYTGHVNWYVDYSHGIRLVYRKIKVNGKWMDYTDVLKDPVLQHLICDEEFCDCARY